MSAGPFDPKIFEPMKHPTPEEAEANIEKAMKQYPHITREQATLLVIYRATANVSAQVSNTSGGGRYPDYCRSIGVPF